MLEKIKVLKMHSISRDTSAEIQFIKEIDTNTEAVSTLSRIFPKEECSNT